MRGATCLCVLLLTAAWAATAQPAERPAFEVASIKVWTPDGGRHGFGGGKRISADALMVRMRAASLRELLEFAYGLQPGTEIRGPDLPGAYDIDAKAGAPSTREQQRLMMQSLLAERFGLKCHREETQGPVYALVARKEAKLAAAAAGGDASIRMTFDRTTFATSFTATHTTMTELADWLAGQLGRPVLNQTGLQGAYDCNLASVMVPKEAPPADGRGMVPMENGPEGYIRALRRLGLDLESRRGAVGVLVVEHVERPAAN